MKSLSSKALQNLAKVSELSQYESDLAFRRLRQEDCHELEVSLSYRVSSDELRLQNETVSKGNLRFGHGAFI